MIEFMSCCIQNIRNILATEGVKMKYYIVIDGKVFIIEKKGRAWKLLTLSKREQQKYNRVPLRTISGFCFEETTNDVDKLYST